MAIEVKHGANPSSTLYGRYGGAEGKAWRGALGKFLQSKERRDLQRDSQDFRADMMDRSHFQQLDRADYLMQQRRQLDNDEYIERKGEFNYRLTAEQKADESKLRQALYLIENDESLSPEERSEARHRIVARMAGIEPLPARQEPSPYAKGQGRGEYWYDEKLGAMLTRDDKDNIKELGGSSGMSDSEMMKAAISNATGEDGTTDWKIVKSNMEEMKRLLGAPQPAGTPGAPDTAGTDFTGLEDTPKVRYTKELQSSLSDIDSQLEALETSLMEDESKLKNKEYRSYYKNRYKSKYEKQKDIENRRDELKKEADALKKKKELLMAHLNAMNMNLSRRDAARDAVTFPINR